MRPSPDRFWLQVACLLLLAGASNPAGAQGRYTATWLDSPLANWNAPGAALPAAPPPDEDAVMLARCRDLARPPASPEDRVLAAAGWMLLGPLQAFGVVTVVQGMGAFDGMCRPWRYQGFVFVEGRLVLW